MKHAWMIGFAILCPLPAQAQEAVTLDGEVYEDIEVSGELPRCNSFRDDPLEEVDVGMGSWEQSVMRPDRRGTMRLLPDTNPIGGPDVWQRAGRFLQDYVFRPSRNGTPMCIGSLRKRARGFAQYRQILDATQYHGKLVRFTAQVATRNGHEVRFWFASGNDRSVLQGGDTANQPLTGTHGSWIPVSLVIGPIDSKATLISYGFLLNGPGIVWVRNPRFEEITADQLGPRAPALNGRPNMPPSSPLPD